MAAKKPIPEVFVEGARKGWGIWTTSTLPNVLMAFVIIHVLDMSGLLTIIGKLLGPVMAIFGLPGEAFAVLVAAWMSMGGGTGAAAALFIAGGLTAPHMAILLPAIYLMGSQVQFMGRCLGTAEVNPRYYGLMLVMAIINAFLAMWVMRLILLVVPVFPA